MEALKELEQHEGLAGERIGAYRIVRVIGRGGMASVYLAVRADDAYERRVALKLLQPGMASPGLMKRFRGERQILASLEHPHIARLFEGGTAPDGRPYLVMEYIDGRPIDEYCEEHGLTVRERLELFRKVCSAVHYAHQNLVVHRDIKPSNVLVTAGGEPRLLDFGIAKLLDPEAFPVTLEATATGQRPPMTPSFASPEQVCGEPVTTATDVYSLGVLLYKLLTGRLPFRLSGLTAPEIELVLTQKEPTRPSAATGGPREKRRRLAGDLDNIVLTALAKEPERRYGSALQLSEDISRYLTGRPVTARKPTFVYQMSKVLRRHRLAVGVAAVILQLIVSFAGAMAWQAAETARQRDQARLERDKAEQVLGFLVEVFEGVDPWMASKGNVTVSEVLDRGAARVERELSDQPLVRATLEDAIGSVYLHLGRFEEAEPLLENALAARRARLGDEHLDVAESLLHLAWLYRDQGRYAEAEPLLLRSQEIRERALGAHHPDVARVLQWRMRDAREQGRYAEAAELGRQALAIFEESLAHDDRDVVSTRMDLAGVFFRQGELEAAESSLRWVLSVLDKTVEGPDMMKASVRVNLAVLRLRAGDFDEAMTLLQEGLAISRQMLDGDHPRIADQLLILAQIFQGQGRTAEAEPRLRRALEIYERALGSEHPSVANCLYELGNLLRKLGRLDEAEPMLERSLALRQRTLPAGHPSIGESLRGLADLRVEQGAWKSAEELYRRAWEIWQQHPMNPSAQGIPEAYGSLLRSTGRADAAGDLEKRARELSRTEKQVSPP